MEVILGNTAGFCYGVKRAVDGAKEEIDENKKIYCLGEIVHNKDVVKELENKGIEFIENVEECSENSELIIRAHGISKTTYENAKLKNLKLKDLTCPNVIKIHEIAEEYANNGYFIILLGNKKHPENIGTISFCGENSLIIEDENDVEDARTRFEGTGIKNLLVISQTTYSLEKFEKIAKKINEKFKAKNIEIKNTICKATQLRQDETKKIANKVDCMVIIGGKNSSNTKKLYEIAEKNCKNAISIENNNDLDIENLKKYSIIGIMAGASTPKEKIEEVKKAIEEL